MRTTLAGLGLLAMIAICLTGTSVPTPVYGYKVVHVYPHDGNAFTQGLEYRGGYLYEGTGLNGRSSLRRVELESGRALRQAPLDSQFFGEGITVMGNRILQLTWRAGKGFVYDRETFRVTGGFAYPGEGWGLANDGRQIYMSDGTAQLRIWSASTLRELRRVTVHDRDTPVSALNELEYVRGEIYANVWLTDRIVRIDPNNGRVTGWIDLSGLLTEADRNEGADVLNGIAYDLEGDRLFVTGKLWLRLFEIKLVRRS